METFLETKDQALDRVIAICKENLENFQALPLFDRISEGYLGVVVGSKVGECNTYYYPGNPRTAANGIPVMAMSMGTDRLEIAQFITEHPSALIFKDVGNQHLNIADLDAGACMYVSALALEKSQALQHTIANMLDNNNDAVRDIFVRIAKEVYNVDASEPLAKAIELSHEVPQVIYTSDLGYYAYDCLDFLAFFEVVYHVDDVQLLEVRDDRGIFMGDYVVYSEIRDERGLQVPAGLMKASTVVRRAMNELLTLHPISGWILVDIRRP